MNKQLSFGGSSKGRTSGFGPDYLGSNPSPPALRRFAPQSLRPEEISSCDEDAERVLSEAKCDEV